MNKDPGYQTSYVDSAGEIGAIIRGRRATLKLSQEELAKRAGVGRRFVVDLEAGKPTVQADALFKVCLAADVELMARQPSFNLCNVVRVVQRSVFSRDR